MGFMSKYNGNSKIEWGVNTDGFEYKKLSTLDQDKTYLMRGCFITRDAGFGKGAVIVTDDCFVSLPERYVPVVGNIMQDNEAVTAIKAGKVSFKVSEFISEQHGRKGYRVDFIDEE